MNVRRIWPVLCAGLGVLLVVPAYASSNTGSQLPVTRLTASAPRLIASARVVDDGVVRISGRFAGHRNAVTVERHTRRGWAVVGRASVRHHTFARHVHQTTRVVTYRVTAGRHHSARMIVRLAPTGSPLNAPKPSVAPATTVTAPSPTASRVTSPATSSTPTRIASDACGTRPTKADGSLWSCTFDDEFSGTVLNRSKWVPQTAFVTGNPDAFACYRDDPRNVSVAGGSLNLTVRRETTPQACAGYPGQSSPYTSGMVSTYHLFSQQYGRFEVRMKSPTYSGTGLQDDFWMWPDDRYPSTAVWPAAGEIDVMEHYSQYAGLNVPYLHYGTDTSAPGVNTAYDCSIQSGAYNTYTLTWTASRLEIDVNGAPCLINTSGDVAFQKPYIMALTQALGTGTNGLTAKTPLPTTTQVDYVRVWS